MADDILMIADPCSYKEHGSSFEVLWLSADEFWGKEDLVKRHDAVLWKSFRTHGKYMKKVAYARWFAVAVDDEGSYVGSAFVIDLQDKWLIEYVMTDPSKRGRGAGSAVMDAIMRHARTCKVVWVILNCDPKAHGGKLPSFYGTFGFKRVVTED